MVLALARAIEPNVISTVKKAKLISLFDILFILKNLLKSCCFRKSASIKLKVPEFIGRYCANELRPF